MLMSFIVENHPTVIASMLVTGIKHPIASAVMGASWSALRIVYAIGYTSKTQEKGKGRLIAAPFWLFQFGLIVLTIYDGVQLLL